MKGISQADAKFFLRDIQPENSFWLNTGPTLKNLEELNNFLPNMSNEQFSYHLNKEKNDFAKWIDEVIGDKKLAKDLANVKTKVALQKIVAKRLAELKKKAI